MKTLIEDIKALFFEYINVVYRNGACRFEFEVSERARDIERALAREGMFRRTDIESVNGSSSNPKYCWRRVDFESFESFVRDKAKNYL